jgi:hypothetical protein
LSKMLLEEVKAAEAEKAGKDKKVREEDSEKDGVDAEKNKEKEKDKRDGQARDRSNENRDWKRNGASFSLPTKPSLMTLVDFR